MMMIPQVSWVIQRNPREGYTAIRKGIDVSHWQNDRGTIDWSAVKNSGVEFVIVKVGGRYNDGSFYTDKCYKKNIEERLRQDFV